MRDLLSNEHRDLPPRIVHRKALSRGWLEEFGDACGIFRDSPVSPNRSSGIYIFRVVHANVTSYFNDRRTKVTFEGSHVLLLPSPSYAEDATHAA